MTLRGVQWTLAQLQADLRIRLDDASDVRWSAAQKALAIQAAVRRARGQWWEERIDDTNTYEADTYRYTLPPGCESIVSVYFEAVDSDAPRFLVVPNRYHRESDVLVFEQDFDTYDGQTMYIHYLVYQTNLLTCTGTVGAIASVTTKALTSVGQTFVTKGVREGDAVEISESGYAGNGTYYVVSVDSETQVTLHKAPGTIGTNLDYEVAAHTDMPYEYLISSAMAELHEMAGRNKPGLEGEAAMRWASYYRQLATDELRKQARHMPPTRSY
jgi:hypothetical protein